VEAQKTVESLYARWAELEEKAGPAQDKQDKRDPSLRSGWQRACG